MNVKELKGLVEKLEERVKRLEDALYDHKQQMQFQLTKDAKLARDLGKKKP